MINASRLVLASNSPRRAELLALGEWSIQVSAGAIDEAQLRGEDPGEYVRRLAREKALAALPVSVPADAIVAADTAVLDGDEVLGKPADAAEAIRMLRQLRSRSHRVFTGLAALVVGTGQLLTDLCVTDVPMRDYSDMEIESYVASGDPMDKAGAYGIQHAGFHPVSHLQGCYASVMGLPLCHLVRLLGRLELPAKPGLPERCQSHLKYACPVSTAILRGEMVG